MNTITAYILPDGTAICALCCDGPFHRTEEKSWFPVQTAPADTLHADEFCDGKRFICNGFGFDTLGEAEAFQAECQNSPYDGQRHHIWDQAVPCADCGGKLVAVPGAHGGQVYRHADHGTYLHPASPIADGAR